MSDEPDAPHTPEPDAPEPTDTSGPADGEPESAEPADAAPPDTSAAEAAAATAGSAATAFAPATEPATAESSGSWPGSAKATSAVLAIIAIAAIIAAAVGFSQASSNADETDDVEQQLAAAEARAATAEQERDELTEQLTDEQDASTSEIETLTEERDAALEANEDLTADLAAETERADAAEARVAEVEEIVGQFPIALDSSLIPDEMPGTYGITYQEAYCEGFSNCGSVPNVTVAEIYTTAEGFLRFRVEGILDAGLFALDGSLYGITDSLTALPPCGGAEQRARITITMYAGQIAVLQDGTRTVTDVNASITIDAPRTSPECPGGLVFYASRLVPQG